MPFKDKLSRKEWDHRVSQSRRQKWIQENGPCAWCGSWNDLEVDHIDPSTKVDSWVWKWKEERRIEELAKCQVLCKDCHRQKSSQELILRKKVLGSRNGAAKLTEEDVLEIRASYATGKITQEELAALFQVSRGLIGHIVRQRNWKHI